MYVAKSNKKDSFVHLTQRLVVVNRDLSFTVDPPVSDHPKCKELVMTDPDLQMREGWGRSQ